MMPDSPSCPSFRNADSTRIPIFTLDGSTSMTCDVSRQPSSISMIARTYGFIISYCAGASWTTVYDTTVPRRETEMIAVAVSAANQCEYCIAVHTARLRALGADPMTVDTLAREPDRLRGAPREEEICAVRAPSHAVSRGRRGRGRRCTPTGRSRIAARVPDGRG